MTSIKQTTTELKITGSVLTVLTGTATTKALKEIKRGNYWFALGSGTFSDPAKLGETIIIEDHIYVSWADKGTVITETQSTVATPFLVGIDEQQKESGIYSTGKFRTLQSLYNELSEQHPLGFAIIGQFSFAEFHSTYLKKAPIYGENINENQEDYWANLPVQKNINGCLFGVVIPPKAKRKSQKAVLDKAFYQSPYESKSSERMSHTHCALLEHGRVPQPENFYESLKDLKVRAVRHLLTPSVIENGLYALFPVDMIHEFKS